MFTPAVAFYSRQTMILPGLAADEGSYARGRKKRKKKKKTWHQSRVEMFPHKK